MGQEYTIAHQVRDAEIVYRCSDCGNLVLLHKKLFAVVKVVSSIFNDTSVDEAAAYMMEQLENDVHDSSDKMLTFLKDRIISPEDAEGILRDQSVPYRYKFGRYVNGCAWIAIDDAFCPICGHREAWQPNGSPPKSGKRLTQENYPQIYHTTGLAEVFIKLKLKERIDRINKARQDSAAVEKARQEYPGKQKHRQELEEKLQQMQASVDEREALARELDALQEQLKRAGAFDFKGKKLLNQQISSKQSEMRRIYEKRTHEEGIIKQELHELEIEIDKLLYLANGVSGIAEVIISGSGRGYRLLPDDSDTAL